MPERIGFEDPYQLVRGAVGQWPQQYRADDAVHRGTGADADRQRGDGDRRVRRVLSQRADAVPEVLQRRVDERQAAALAVRLLNLHRSSKPQDRLAAGLLRCQSATGVVLGQHVEMGFDLAAEVLVQTRRDEQCPDPGRQHHEADT